MLIRQYVFNVRLFLSLVILPRDLRDKIVRLLVEDFERELHALRAQADYMMLRHPDGRPYMDVRDYLDSQEAEL